MELKPTAENGARLCRRPAAAHEITRAGLVIQELQFHLHLLRLMLRTQPRSDERELLS